MRMAPFLGSQHKRACIPKPETLNPETQKPKTLKPLNPEHSGPAPRSIVVAHKVGDTCRRMEEVPYLEVHGTYYVAQYRGTYDPLGTMLGHLRGIFTTICFRKNFP